MNREITTIYFVRHAKPDRGPDSPFTDRTYPLSAKGLNDCILVTTFFEDKNIDAVLSSPFVRAVDTVKPFADKYGHKIELVEGFRERAISNTWIPIEDFKAFAAKQWVDFSYKLPEGECLQEVLDRNVDALAYVLDHYHGKTLLIGTHGMSLTTLLYYFGDAIEPDGHKNMPMPFVVKMEFLDGACVGIQKTDLFHQNRTPIENSYQVTMSKLESHKWYQQAVVFARYNGKWLYCRHHSHETYDALTGTVKHEETALDCASRQLHKAMGATKFEITPAFDFEVQTNQGFYSGQVFFANVQELGNIPENSQIASVRKFETYPSQMRWPRVLPELYTQMSEWFYHN